MTAYEKSVIETLPEKYRPIGSWQYFLYSLLFAIPLVGFVFSLVISLKRGNINRRSYARFWLFVNIAAIVLCAISVVAVLLFTDISFTAVITKILEYIK